MQQPIRTNSLTILVAAFLLGTIGCQSGGSDASNNATANPSAPVQINTASTGGPMPAWVTSPPAPTAQWMYAIGTASDPSAAIDDGLARLAAQLNVSVQSAYSERIAAQINASGESFSAQAERTLQTQVGQLTLNNHRVVENFQQGSTHYTLLQLDKILLKKDLMSRLNDARTSLENSFRRAQNDPKLLEQLKSFNATAAEARKARAMVYYLMALDPQFADSSLLDRLTRIEQAHKDFQQTLTFFVRGDPNVRPTENFIRDNLIDNGFRVLRDRTELSSAGILLEISGVARTQSAGSAYQTSLTTRFAMKQGDILLYSANFDSTGSAPNRKDALQAACMAFIDHLSKEGLLDTLGIER